MKAMSIGWRDYLNHYSHLAGMISYCLQRRSLSFNALGNIYRECWNFTFSLWDTLKFALEEFQRWWRSSIHSRSALVAFVEGLHCMYEVGGVARPIRSTYYWLKRAVKQFATRSWVVLASCFYFSQIGAILQWRLYLNSVQEVVLTDFFQGGLPPPPKARSSYTYMQPLQHCFSLYWLIMYRYISYIMYTHA